MAIASPPRSTDTEPIPGADPVPARRRSPFRGRVAAGHLVMVVAGLLGVASSFVVLRDRPSGVPVLVADGEIRAGDIVDADDFRTARVESSGALLGALVAAEDVRRMRGLIAVASVADGAPIVRSQLRRRAAPGGMRAMSIPIDASRAAGGRI